MTDAVSVDDIAVERAGALVLEAVDLDADAGSFVALVGPNGAGKTTLLEAVRGALPVSDGAVRLRGDNVRDLDQRTTGRRAATVPQDTATSFDFTVRRAVEMGRYPHRGRFGTPDDADVVEEALERADAEELTGRTVGELSAGERQRVLIARALAQDAPVVLADEPTGALDVDHAERVMGLLRGLVDDGRTVLAAIHDLETAAQYCDHAVLLHDGRVRARGPPDAVFTTDVLRGVYGTDLVVVPHPLTGDQLVLPASRGDGDASVHVLGHGRAAAEAAFEAWRRGHAVTVGPAPAGGIADEVAEALDVECLTHPAAAGVDDALLTEVRRRVEDADRVVTLDVAPEDLVDAVLEDDGGRVTEAAVDGGSAVDRSSSPGDRRPFNLD